MRLGRPVTVLDGVFGIADSHIRAAAGLDVVAGFGFKDGERSLLECPPAFEKRMHMWTWRSRASKSWRNRRTASCGMRLFAGDRRGLVPHCKVETHDFSSKIVGQRTGYPINLGGMQQDEIWDKAAAQHYDTPGVGMFAPEVLDPTVDRLAELAGDGAALEFAIGTGRVAVPLAGRGVPVTGIELSQPMIEQLRTKAGEETIPVVVGDMATATAPGKFTLVYLVFNTISNLLTQQEQVACFRNAARHLSPGGRFVIELWVPELRQLPPGRQATVFHSEPGYIGLDTYDVVKQHVVSHHFRFGEGREASLFRSPHRYIWPAELDLMAQLAGFELESRHADWVGAEFTADTRSHVSVYRL
ncbi:MAG TPA: class I SAM-dependent methyltransferase [Candidatus Limnocylindrales bacterium]